MGASIAPGEGDVLLVVDVQNDFCPGGSLAIADGDAVVPPINRLAEDFGHVVVTQDWHPPGHLSFASSHLGAQPFVTVTLPYGEQTLWPDHCVQDTPGAEFHDGLDVPRAELVLRKGFRPKIDSYSAFYENDQTTATGLAGYLRERGLGRVFCAGLALDFCVRYSAEDAVRCGFEAFVIADACRAIDNAGSLVAAYRGFAESGVRVIAAHEISVAA